MGMVKVRVSDISGSRINEVEAPDDVAVSRILVVLVERMNLPLNSPDGQLMSYKLHHRRTGSQLLDNQTFGQANVMEGDELRLQPEITAGVAKHNVQDKLQEVKATVLPGRARRRELSNGDQWRLRTTEA